MAEPKNKPAEGEKDVIQPIASFFKSLTNFDLNSLASVAGPTIRKLAIKLAQKLNKDLPTNHPLRGDFAEMTLDLAAQQIKNAAEGQTPVVKATLKEFGEFIESFGQEFCGERGGQGEKKPVLTSESPQNLDGRFMKRAEEELSHATLDSMDSVLETLLKEFDAQLVLQARIEDAAKARIKVEPPKRKVKSWTKSLGPINTSLTNTIKNWEAAERKQRKKTPARKPNLLEKIVEWPGKAAWNFLMPK